MLGCNGQDTVKVRQERSKRTEGQHVNQGKQMTAPSDTASWCALAWTSSPTSVLPSSSRIEPESRMPGNVACPVWEGGEAVRPTYPYTYYTASDGQTVENPRLWRCAEKQIKRLSRRLSRKKK